MKRLNRRWNGPIGTRVGERATGISWGSSSLTAGCMALRSATGDGWRRYRNETRPIIRGDGEILSSVEIGMKRPTHAEQGRTWPLTRLHQTRVGCLAESRLEQKEDYGRDVSQMALGGDLRPGRQSNHADEVFAFTRLNNNMPS